MNKSTFFTELNSSLEKLSKEEREDILRDMEEHFYEGRKRGLSEEELIEKLGSPKKIGDTFVAETKVKRINQAKTVPQKVAAYFSALLAILILAPISFIVILIPLLIIGSILIGLWHFTFLLLLGLLPVLFLSPVAMFSVSFNLLALLTIVFLAIGYCSFVVAVFVAMCLLSLWLFKGTVKLFQWTINFIKKEVRD